jgi:hypothetical protein
MGNQEEEMKNLQKEDIFFLGKAVTILKIPVVLLTRS